MPSHHRSHPLKLTLSFPSHPAPSRSPPNPSLSASPCRHPRPLLAGLSSPLLSSFSPHLRATPLPPTVCARNPRRQKSTTHVGQKLDFLGAGDELLGGRGAGSMCTDAGSTCTSQRRLMWSVAGAAERGLLPHLTISPARASQPAAMSTALSSSTTTGVTPWKGHNSSYGLVFSMDMDMVVSHGRSPLDSIWPLPSLMHHACRPTRREDHHFSDSASSRVAMEGIDLRGQADRASDIVSNLQGLV